VRRKRLLLILLLTPLLLYAAICAILFFAQTALVFPVAQVAPAGPLPVGTEELELRAGSGEMLRGYHIPPSRPAGDGLLILGFGGNGANAATTANQLHDLYPEADIVAFYYRGYPPSEGTPSAAALREDALRIFDDVRAHPHPARIVAAGFSIGSGVAASLAAARPLDGLILVTPFDSLGAVAASRYPWLPVRLLLRHELAPARDLGGRRVPVAILAGGRDAIVPPARTQALREAVADLVYDRTLADAGHNDIYADPAFAGAMREALQRVLEDRR
jgi:pimeloyl-ACP methyl ester carboxylesterase